jgi:hypothetical protein
MNKRQRILNRSELAEFGVLKEGEGYLGTLFRDVTRV